MSNNSPARVVEGALQVAASQAGLPLAFEMHQMSNLTAPELVTLALFAAPAIVWRGRLCFECDRALKRTTLEPHWVLYEADETGLSSDVVSAANRLSQRGMLIALPRPNQAEVLKNDYASRLTRLPPVAQENYAIVDSLFNRLDALPTIPVMPRPKHRPPSGASSYDLSFPLPVLFNCPSDRYEDFIDSYRSDLVRFHHALREVYDASQTIENGSAFKTIAQELDYQIAKLNEVYRAAARKHWLGGAGVVLGLVVTTLSLFVPKDLMPVLLALGSPATLAAGLHWLGTESTPEGQCRQSDFFLAWRFRTKQ